MEEADCIEGGKRRFVEYIEHYIVLEIELRVQSNCIGDRLWKLYWRYNTFVVAAVIRLLQQKYCISTTISKGDLQYKSPALSVSLLTIT
jgi:hypothetical protein